MNANRMQLIAALRNLPDDWEWDYGSHEKCGMGLARAIGIQFEPFCSSAIAPPLGLDPARSFSIFICLGDNVGSGEHKEDVPVTAEDVARALERVG